MSHDTGEPRGSMGRDRLLTTAQKLFTRHGASNVGINDVTGAAGVARMTLYNNFASKDALTAAVYADMAQTTLQGLQAMARTACSDDDNILAIFDHFDIASNGSDYRGCPFIHASLQAAEPAGTVYALVRAYKRDLREHVFGLLDAGRPNRAELADQIVLLLDGAVTEAYLKGVADPVTVAKRATVTLLRATP